MIARFSAFAFISVAIPSQRLNSACTEKLVGGLSLTRHFEVIHSVLLEDSLRPISARLSATKSSALRQIVPTRVGFVPQSLEMAAGCVDWKSPALSRASKSERRNITKRLSSAAAEDSPTIKIRTIRWKKGFVLSSNPSWREATIFYPQIPAMRRRNASEKASLCCLTDRAMLGVFHFSTNQKWFCSKELVVSETFRTRPPHKVQGIQEGAFTSSAWNSRTNLLHARLRCGCVGAEALVGSAFGTAMITES